MGNRPSNYPWVKHQSADVGVTPGGEVHTFLAGAALLVGDVVYLSAAKTVNKSTTGSNHDKVVGVVVGGAATYGNVHSAEGDVGIAAASTGEEVLVCVRGIVYVTASGAISVGAAIAPSTGTAGRVRAATALAGAVGTLVVAAGATPVTSTAANGAIITGAPTISGDDTGRKLGKAITAATNNGDVILALISI